MGTSKSYGGPTGITALLPAWADAVPEEETPGAEPPSGDEQKEKPPTDPKLPLVSWRGPKASITRYAGGGSSSLRSTFRSYVAAHGGSRGAARANVAGQRTTARVMGFFADAARNGFTEAARRLGLADFVGRDVEFVVASLIDLLAPEGALLEDAAARAAAIATMAELFEVLDLEENGIEAIERMSEADLAKAFEIAVANTIECRLEMELTSRVERAAMTDVDANRVLDEITDHIRGVVSLDLEGVDLLAVDWNGPAGSTFVESWFAAAYAVLEDAP